MCHQIVITLHTKQHEFLLIVPKLLILSHLSHYIPFTQGGSYPTTSHHISHTSIMWCSMSVAFWRQFGMFNTGHFYSKIHFGFWGGYEDQDQRWKRLPIMTLQPTIWPSAWKHVWRCKVYVVVIIIDPSIPMLLFYGQLRFSLYSGAVITKDLM